MPAVLLSTGRRYRYEPPSLRGKGALEFWAENGMIMITDERFPVDDDRSFDCLTVREFLQNLWGLNLSVPRIANQHHTAAASGAGTAGGSSAEERDAIQRFVTEGIACAKEAQAQGCPDNPKHLEQMARQRRRSMITVA